MVARGDLGMEIPVQKVAIAQKLLINTANLAGKFVICATQMMESMIKNHFPTAAECADIANAVFDGADACMLSGETANGSHPVDAVRIMASVLQQSELGVNYNQTFNFIRTCTPKPMGTVEASVCTLAKSAVDIRPGMVVVFSEQGKMARYAAKYRPCAPILVVTSNEHLARACSANYACYPMLLNEPMRSNADIFKVLKRSLAFGVANGLCVPGKEIVVLASTAVTTASMHEGESFGAERELFVTVAPGKLQFEKLGSLAPNLQNEMLDESFVAKTVSLRATRMDMDMVTQESKVCFSLLLHTCIRCGSGSNMLSALLESTQGIRKTKIIGTILPTTDPVTIKELIMAGMDVLRINLAHSSARQLTEVVSEYKAACQTLQKEPCILCELRGAELRSCWLISRETSTPADSVELARGQAVTLVGTDDTSRDKFIGWSSLEDSRIAIGFEKLAAIAPIGSTVCMLDGSVQVKVTERLSESEIRGVVVADCTLRSHTKVVIKGQRVRLPFLRPQDTDDLKWIVQNGINFVAVPLTRHESDIEELRCTLSNHRGAHVR
jgi:pyruvate kinase